MSYPKNFLHYLQAIKIITALLWNPSTSISSKLVLFFGIAQYFRKSFYIKAFVWEYLSIEAISMTNKSINI